MMKKIFIVVLLVCVCKSYSQDYHFDTMMVYSIETDNRKINNLQYVNSKNSSYKLSVHKNSDNDFSATLTILGKNITFHHYGVKATIVKGKYNFDFTYVETTEITKHTRDLFSKHRYEFETIQEEEDYKKVILRTYRNFKTKKTSMSYELELSKYDGKMFPFFRLSYLHPYEFVENFTLNEDYIVTSAKTLSKKYKPRIYKLIETQLVDFSVKVP